MKLCLYKNMLQNLPFTPENKAVEKAFSYGMIRIDLYIF